MWICLSTSKPLLLVLPLLSVFWPFPESNCLVYNITSYLTSCFQEVCDLRHRHEISHMWPAGGCCSPVNFKFPFFQYLLQLLFPQNLLLWKQKSWFNAGNPPCSSFTLWQGKQRYVSLGVSRLRASRVGQPCPQPRIRASLSWCCC